VPQQAPETASEAIPQFTAAIELRITKRADITLAASHAAEDLQAPRATVLSARAAKPVTLALASAKLSPLKSRQGAVPEVRTRTPKIAAVALR
jgi:hypothetical protein